MYFFTSISQHTNIHKLSILNRPPVCCNISIVWRTRVIKININYRTKLFQEQVSHSSTLTGEYQLQAFVRCRLAHSTVKITRKLILYCYITKEEVLGITYFLSNQFSISIPEIRCISFILSVTSVSLCTTEVTPINKSNSS
jgi:hypothetical protein